MSRLTSRPSLVLALPLLLARPCLSYMRQLLLRRCDRSVQPLNCHPLWQQRLLLPNPKLPTQQLTAQLQVPHPPCLSRSSAAPAFSCHRRHRTQNLKTFSEIRIARETSGRALLAPLSSPPAPGTEAHNRPSTFTATVTWSVGAAHVAGGGEHCGCFD